MSVDQMLGITSPDEPSQTDVLSGLRETEAEMDDEAFEAECGR
jgi:hypothetical protein